MSEYAPHSAPHRTGQHTSKNTTPHGVTAVCSLMKVDLGGFFSEYPPSPPQSLTQTQHKKHYLDTYKSMLKNMLLGQWTEFISQIILHAPFVSFLFYQMYIEASLLSPLSPPESMLMRLCFGICEINSAKSSISSQSSATPIQH